MRIRSVAVALLMSFVAAVAAQDVTQKQAKAESFSPQGQIKDVRQVVARFSQPMVSFGDPRSEAPFEAPHATRVCLKLGVRLLAPCGTRQVLVALPAPGRHQIRLENAEGALLAEATVEVRGVPR